MKTLKDYLHLYIGCDFVYSGTKDYLALSLTPEIFFLINQDNDFGEIKLILRPLSDITEPEKLEVWGLVECGQDEVQFSSKYDWETHNPQLTVLMCKLGFDLFGLIAAGLAIDKTKINN